MVSACKHRPGSCYKESVRTSSIGSNIALRPTIRVNALNRSSLPDKASDHVLWALTFTTQTSNKGRQTYTLCVKFHLQQGERPAYKMCISWVERTVCYKCRTPLYRDWSEPPWKCAWKGTPRCTGMEEKTRDSAQIGTLCIPCSKAQNAAAGWPLGSGPDDKKEANSSTEKHDGQEEADSSTEKAGHQKKGESSTEES